MAIPCSHWLSSDVASPTSAVSLVLSIHSCAKALECTGSLYEANERDDDIAAAEASAIHPQILLIFNTMSTR